MPGKPRCEHVSATVTAIGRSLYEPRFLEGQSPAGLALHPRQNRLRRRFRRGALRGRSPTVLSHGDLWSRQTTQRLGLCLNSHKSWTHNTPEKVHANSTLWLVIGVDPVVNDVPRWRSGVTLLLSPVTGGCLVAGQRQRYRHGGICRLRASWTLL